MDVEVKQLNDIFEEYYAYCNGCQKRVSKFFPDTRDGEREAELAADNHESECTKNG